ncbi:hypothetical protein AVEN_148752-1 [Araneus ventricosus]|uniref:Uncharacterized protein n=1 Tax=Araneus ventricosus TaxID=182803 RepID=A0A4Y2TZA6_ARAVE|nr:hypothetical protein AVEN_148752-1 [Araneus ventricosus]
MSDPFSHDLELYPPVTLASLELWGVSLISAKKVPLSTSPEGNTMLAMSAAALKFKEAGREELAEKFGRVLASACAWEGSRLNKKTSECAENIDKLC